MKDSVKKAQKKYFKGLRRQALHAYSKGEKLCCECCGESEIEFLSLDHINGGGSKHRKEHGYGSTFYLWLRKNHYPPGYRVLCHNCNLSLGYYGYCPHNVLLDGTRDDIDVDR